MYLAKEIIIYIYILLTNCTFSKLLENLEWKCKVMTSIFLFLPSIPPWYGVSLLSFVADENCIRWGGCIRPGWGVQKAHAQASISSACPGNIRFYCGSKRENGSGAQGQGQKPVTQVWREKTKTDLKNEAVTSKLLIVHFNLSKWNLE